MKWQYFFPEDKIESVSSAFILGVARAYKGKEKARKWGKEGGREGEKQGEKNKGKKEGRRERELRRGETERQSLLCMHHASVRQMASTYPHPPPSSSALGPQTARPILCLLSNIGGSLLDLSQPMWAHSHHLCPRICHLYPTEISTKGKMDDW